MIIDFEKILLKLMRKSIKGTISEKQENMRTKLTDWYCMTLPKLKK